MVNQRNLLAVQEIELACTQVATPLQRMAHSLSSWVGKAHADIIMFLVEEHLVDPILEGISRAGRFDKPGTGIAFVLPVDQVIGLESQIGKFKKKARDVMNTTAHFIDGMATAAAGTVANSPQKTAIDNNPPVTRQS